MSPSTSISSQPSAWPTHSVVDADRRAARRGGPARDVAGRVDARRAGLLDELTEDVAIASSDDLLDWECAEFVKATLQRDVGRNLCPWTKVGQIHKNDLPTVLPGPITTEGRESVLKAVVDSLWNASFEYALGQFDWDTKNRLSFDLDPETLALVAQRKAEQLAKGMKRDQVRLDEFSQQVRDRATPVSPPFCVSGTVRVGFRREWLRYCATWTPCNALQFRIRRSIPWPLAPRTGHHDRALRAP